MSTHSRSRRRWIVPVAAIIAGLVLAAPASGAGATTVAGLRASLDAQMAQAGPQSAAYVVDLKTGRAVYDVRSGTRLIPASLEKLYTTSAALMALGPDTRLSTAVLGTGRRVGSTWEGDLYLRGSGDFTFGSAAFNRRAYGGGSSVEALALALHGDGITEVKGSVFADASRMADGPGRPFSLLLCSRPLFGRGCPYGPRGEFLRPIPNGPRSAVTVDRGLLGAAGADTQSRPALFAARLLVRQLRLRGIAVTGEGKVGRTPRSAQRLATTTSPTMAQLAALTNKPSDNYAAELLFRLIGARSSGTGSRASGAAAVRRILARRFGIHPQIHNGSGEGGRNRTSPREVVRLLTGMSKQPVAGAFTRSLSVAGRSGTVSDRLRGTAAAGRCQVKDGTLTDPLVGTMAGYCRTVGGRTLAFAIMTNGIPIRFDPVEQVATSKAFGIEDRMLAALAGFRALPRSATLVSSPRPGQVVRANAVRIRMRVPGKRYAITARLNGTLLPRHAARPSAGVRTLRASVSHGLRRGANVLQVRLRDGARVVRTARVRFRVAPSRALVGAGRDRTVVAGQSVSLRGTIANPGGDRLNALKASSRWRLVDAPRRLSGSDTTPLVSLTSPDGPAAEFTATTPGSHTLEFTVGTGPTATSDRATIDVLPSTPSVSVDTMALEGSTPGILVDGEFRAKPGNGPLQVVVFNRGTLEFVSNKAYSDGAALARDMDSAKLKDDALVIVSQRAQGNNFQQSGLMEVLSKRLGFPNLGPLATTKWISGIGVPGMAPGEADVNIDPVYTSNGEIGGGGEKGLKGYLARDQNLAFAFVPSAQVAFDHAAPADAICLSPAVCTAGYRVLVQDGRTLAVASDTNYVTNQLGSGEGAAKAMLADLKQLSGSDRLVTITSFASRERDGSVYQAPIASAAPSQGGVDKATMNALADAVAALGGTHHAFNTTALTPGAQATRGLTYTLVGWTGAGEGKGVESASGQHGTPADAAATLSGTLRPDRVSSFRPVESSEGPDTTNMLSRLVWSPPGTVVGRTSWQDCAAPGPGERWPLDDNPGAQAAIKYLTSTDGQLGGDARVAYWYAGGDQAHWDGIAVGIHNQVYPGGEAYTADQFAAAKKQLECELHMVGRVRAFMNDLAKPFSATTIDGWVTTQRIADDVWAKSQRPDGKVTMNWLEFTNLLLEAASPFTGHVSGAVASFMKIGMWAFGDDEDGGSNFGDVSVEASKLGAELVSQAKISVKTFDRMGDIIVSDYYKLVEVGSHANCVPDKDHPEACPEEYRSTPDSQTAMETAADRAIEATAYEEIVPITYRVFELNGTRNAKPQFKTAPPNFKEYRCDTGYQSFYYIEDNSPSAGYVLQDADPAGLENNYRTFLTAEDPGHSQYGTALSKEISDKMFGPLKRSNDPNSGLGLDRRDFMWDAPHHAWWRGTIGNDPCWWGKVF